MGPSMEENDLFLHIPNSSRGLDRTCECNFELTCFLKSLDEKDGPTARQGKHAHLLCAVV